MENYVACYRQDSMIISKQLFRILHHQHTKHGQQTLVYKLITTAKPFLVLHETDAFLTLLKVF